VKDLPTGGKNTKLLSICNEKKVEAVSKIPFSIFLRLFANSVVTFLVKSIPSY
jgi:hypothetical protein